MTETRLNDAVRRSTLAWLTRLGWNHLAAEEMRILARGEDSPILVDRLLPAIRSRKFVHQGTTLILSEESMAFIARTVERTYAGSTWATASAALRRMLCDGISVPHTLPGGKVITINVQLIDWKFPNRNHWDVADDRRLSGALRAAGIHDLICFVNGIPLALLACVERDKQAQWGRVEIGIAHLARGMEQSPLDPPCRQAQVLIALDRRGARYAGVGTPAHGWLRWREQGWDQKATRALRALDINRPTDTPDTAFGVHAETLSGLLTPGRLLRLVHDYMQACPLEPLRLARSAQFFAVQACLRHLHTVASSRRRNDGQVCLSAGSGLQRVREWLLLEMKKDEALATLSVLMPVTLPARPAPSEPESGEEKTPSGELRSFLEGAPGAQLELPLDVLLFWAQTSTSDPHCDERLVLLLDGDFWDSDPAAQRALRDRFPQASWLSLSSVPVTTDVPGLDPGPQLYCYDRNHAIADDVVAPLWSLSPDLGEPALPADPHDPEPIPEARVALMASFITRHFVENVFWTERDLRGVLLVESTAHARQYEAAFTKDGRLSVMTWEGDAPGQTPEPRHPIPPLSVDLVIWAGALPVRQEPRLGIAYVDRALSPVERLRVLGLINQNHENKHVALLVDFHGDAVGDDPCWWPSDTRAGQPALQHHRRRLRSVLPTEPGRDFHACIDHLAPHWQLSTRGEDQDVHRQRRHLFHRRVTAFGLDVQLSSSSEHVTPSHGGGRAAVEHREELQQFSLLRDAASRDALEDDRFSRDDVRVRHWARATTAQVREEALDYGAIHAALDAPDLPLQHANKLHTRLRDQIEQPRRAAHLQEDARQALRQVLADHADPSSRIEAMRDLQSRMPSLLGGTSESPFSLGALLLEGLAAGDMDPQRLDDLGERIDEEVRRARALLPQRSRRFRQHIRASLYPVLEAALGQDQTEHILEALLTHAPHWPSPE